jgi:hypothetical protein
MSRISNLQTIYAEGRTVYEQNIIRLKPSSNCKVVSIRTDRVCAECGKSLEKGTRCYTLNSKGKGRTWVCFSCIPEPNVAETREIGERFGHGVNTCIAYYSEAMDSLGRHRTYGELDFIEEDFYDSRRERAIEESMPNEY